MQFHPEVVHTRDGQEILKNFLYEVAGAPPSWTPAAVIEEQVERIRAQVGSERVICGLSGGVDSSVAALLLQQAGHEVVGVTMKLWGGDSDTGCCSVSDVDDARRVAQQLGIDHLVFNFGDDFDRHVVEQHGAAEMHRDVGQRNEGHRRLPECVLERGAGEGQQAALIAVAAIAAMQGLGNALNTTFSNTSSSMSTASA